MRTITNSDDIIDSRDVIERIEELEADREVLVEAVSTAGGEDGDADPDKLVVAEEALSEWDDGDDAEELASLRKLATEGESNISDWSYGATLINDSYFIDYAQELAENIGAVSRNTEWPNNYIDWEAAAEALKDDYTALDFDGVTFWARS